MEDKVDEMWDWEGLSSYLAADDDIGFILDEQGTTIHLPELAELPESVEANNIVGKWGNDSSVTQFNENSLNLVDIDKFSELPEFDECNILLQNFLDQQEAVGRRVDVKPMLQRQRVVQNSYKCVECGKIFKYKQALIGHLTTHFLDQNQRYNLEMAQCKTLNPVQKEFFSRLDQLAPLNRKQCELIRNQWKCDVCGKVYKCEGFLDRHILTHDPPQSSLSNLQEIQSQNLVQDQGVIHSSTSLDGLLNQNSKSKNRNQYSCGLCCKVFTNKRNFRRHELSHKPAYKCPECDKYFPYRYRLKLHMNANHGIRDQYPCNDCRIVYFSKEGLRCHRKKHTGQCDFTCDICGRSFQTRSRFNAHTLTHLGKKKFVCEFKDCGKAFTNKTNLLGHKQKHSSFKRFLCEICGIAFKHMSTLKVHQRKLHTNPLPQV